MKKKKFIIGLLLLCLAIFIPSNIGCDSVEEKILNDISFGSSIGTDVIERLIFVDEPNKDFYVCVGETESKQISVIAICYKKTGFMQSDEKIFSKEALLSKDKYELIVDDEKIIFGFTNDFSTEGVLINGESVTVHEISCTDKGQVSTVGFWYQL